MAPPLTTPTHFPSTATTYEFQYPDPHKVDTQQPQPPQPPQPQKQQQQQQQQQQQNEPQPKSKLRTLFTRSTLLVKNAYDLILINLFLPLLSLIYFKHSSSPLIIPTASTTSFNHGHSFHHPAAPFTTFIGQLFFGYLGDAYGRHKFYSLDLMIIIFGTLFCALSSARWSDVYGGGGSGAAVIQYLTFWRFVLAFGIGGDYPISATVPSEEAVTVRRRGGQFITILTSIQGLGNLMASLVTLMVLIRFRTLIVDDDAESMDMVWRICIAVGCLPALSTVLIRFTMPPSPPMSAARLNEDPQSRFNDDDDGIDVFPLDYNSAKEHGPNDATDITPSPPVQSSTTTPSRSPSRSPMPPQRQRRGHTTVFREYCSRWENLKVLIGTSLSWFLLDLAFRSISLNQSYLFDALGMTKPTDDNINQHDLDTSITNKTTLYHQLWVTTLGNLAVSLLGIVPGYWFAIFSIEKMGRKRTQFVGFAVVTLFFILLSTAFHQLKAIVPLFITTFTLSQFFSNLGRSTPFVIPGEVFPTRVRATAHGISAGSGKVGAILATLMFNRLVEMESPLSESFFTSSSSSSFSTFTATVVGTVSALAVIAFVFLIAAFIFPRGARRLLTSKLAWPRKASQGQRQH